MVALAASSSAVRASNRFSQIVLFIYSGVLRLDFHSNKLLYRRFNGRGDGNVIYRRRHAHANFTGVGQYRADRSRSLAFDCPEHKAEYPGGIRMNETR